MIRNADRVRNFIGFVTRSLVLTRTMLKNKHGIHRVKITSKNIMLIFDNMYSLKTKNNLLGWVKIIAEMYINE